MLADFWKDVGNKLAERWVATVLTPAFVFWVGGLGAWVWQHGWTPLEQWFTQQPQAVQATLLIAGALAIALSAVIVEHLTLPVLRLLEGYWPGWMAPLRRRLARRQAARIAEARQRWRQLLVKDSELRLPEEQEEIAALQWRLRLMPVEPNRFMPTALGNILRGAEGSSEAKYGLNAMVCWPRLWLLLPDDVRRELAEARSKLDTGTRMWLWSILLLVWIVWAWWAIPVALVGVFGAYRWMLGAAEVYGVLVESTFDVHRLLLYKSLRWPLPADSVEEQRTGKELTKYLFLGSEPDQAIPLVTSSVVESPQSPCGRKQ